MDQIRFLQNQVVKQCIFKLDWKPLWLKRPKVISSLILMDVCMKWFAVLSQCLSQKTTGHNELLVIINRKMNKVVLHYLKTEPTFLPYR